jgi:serine/threonine protein kinase
VLFHIAEGTFARVYRGVRSDSGTPVAIKVLRRRFTSDASAVNRFAQEAEAGLSLHHPNIVRIFEYGEIDRMHFMVMEYVEGSNLRDFLKLRQRLDTKEALPILLGLASGLKYSHDQHVTHRDIKGTNVLISTKREAKLVDFGLATVGADRIDEVAHSRTVDYSALERTCGSPKGDPRSDIYFLGTVYYQMLTGVLPLPEVEATDRLAKMLKRSFGAIKPIGEMRYAPPEELCRIIEKMMKMDLQKRYQSMGEVLNDLEAFYMHETKGAPLPSRGPTSNDDDLFFQAFEKRASFHKHVLCVEVQDSIQQAFKKSLTPLGYRVLLVNDAERAAERYVESPPDAVVFDADGLGEEALDAFLAMHNKAHDDGHDLAAVVLLGVKQHELASKLPTDDRLAVLHKPIKMKDVQDALARLVPQN